MTACTVTPFPVPAICPATAPGPAITTRQELDALLENIAELHYERDELRRAQETELNAVRHRYRAPLAELDHLIEVETSWAELWAQAHRDVFAAEQTLASAHATIGFRAAPPHLERASRRWTWTRIATTLAALPWGRRYLRVPPPEVDKEAIVADLLGHLGRPALAPEDLRTAGIRVVHGERFYLEPHPDHEHGSDQDTAQPCAA